MLGDQCDAYAAPDAVFFGFGAARGSPGGLRGVPGVPPTGPGLIKEAGPLAMGLVSQSAEAAPGVVRGAAWAQKSAQGSLIPRPMTHCIVLGCPESGEHVGANCLGSNRKIIRVTSKKRGSGRSYPPDAPVRRCAVLLASSARRIGEVAFLS